MRPAIVAVCITAALSACEREQRTLQQPPDESVAIKSSNEATAAAVAPRMQRNAYSLAEGKRLYGWYNCSGCHANGGGDKGPALMDDVWLYGSDEAAIFTSIIDGRPNGMPAFGGRIAEHEAWEIAAYVRSMSGLAPSDAAPGRNDSMQSKPAESRTDPQPPRPASESKP